MTHRPLRHLAAPALTALAALAGMIPTTAQACGGFFRTVEPVDQSAERVIFRQIDANTVESIIDIRYDGPPADFAWIIPVPGVPRNIDTFSPGVFEYLDRLTDPQFPLPTDCALAESVRTPDANGCAGDGCDFAGAAGGVTPLDHQIVGDYEIDTVAATDAQSLVSWLRAHGYRVVDGMTPFIDLYIGQGLNFTAAKLKPGADAGGIKPLRMTYASGTPMIPLRLTSIAALPEMGVKVFLLGDTRATSASVPELAVDESQIVLDAVSGRANWPALVARTIDNAQGEGMVADYAQPTDTAVDALSALVEQAAQTPENPQMPGVGPEDAATVKTDTAALLASAHYITRLYGRYSPEEMGVDLTFEAAPNLPNVDAARQIELSQTIGCDLQAEPSGDPCAFAACGQGGLCVLSPDELGVPQAACACVDGAVARAVNDSAAPSQTSVSCIDVRMDVDPVAPVAPNDPLDPGTVETPDGGTHLAPLPKLPNPCDAAPCGAHGACVSINAQQTCQCEHGYVAIARVDDAGKVSATCQAASAPVPDDFYKRPLPEPRLPFPGKAALHGKLTNNGCSVGAVGRGASPLFLILLAAPALVSRRRRSR